MSIYMNITRKDVVILAIASIAYVSPILLSGSYYIDDINRSIYGYGWQHDGRPLSTLIMQLLSGGKIITDLYPFTQVISSFLLFISGYIISKVCKLHGYSAHLGAAIFATCPFFLQGLSYRYDCLPISLSVFFCMLSFCFNFQNHIDLLFSAILITLSLLIYQSSIMIFCLMTVIYCTSQLREESIKNICLFIFDKILSVFISLVIFFWLTKILSLDFSDRNKFITEGDIILNLTENLHNFKSIATSYLNESFFIYFSPLIILTITYTIKQAFYLGLKRSIFAAVLFFCALLMLPGINLILASPYWTPRTVTTLAFLPFIFIGFCNLKDSKAFIWLSCISLILPISICTSYASSLKSQDDLTSIISEFIYDKSSAFHGKKIVFIGSMPVSHQLTLSMIKFPVLGYMSPNYLNDQTTWGVALLRSKSVIPSDMYVEGGQREELLKQVSHSKLIANSYNVSIKESESAVFIDFR